MSFAGDSLTPRKIPVGLSFIDVTTIRLQSGTDYYLQRIINEGLSRKEKIGLSVAYRNLKEDFAKKDSILAINKKIDNDKGEITDKNLAIKLDVSQKSRWETNLIPHLDDIPFQYSGGGEQSALKIMLALEKKVDGTDIILIEEPENHLSFSSMNVLLGKIVTKCSGKQIIVSTHSSFVLNKLGLEKLHLISGGKNFRLKHLSQGTLGYFKKLSGYDTLRLILSKRAILVEGSSDELLLQKAYLLKHNELPIKNGTDVINVRGLSFKRFLDIAKELKIDVTVVTDNDGDYKENVEEKYMDYQKYPNIKICSDKNNSVPTLESQIADCNELDVLNLILEKAFKDKKKLVDYMETSKNKTECALKLFDTKEKFVIPQYIQDAVEQE